MCQLCKLVEDIDRGTANQEILHNDPVFVAVYCKTHKTTPMAVLRRHTPTPTKQELEHIGNTMNEKYPDRKARGKGMKSIRNHWHEHWVNRKGN